MSRRIVRKLNTGKKMLLAGVGTLTVAVFGIMNGPSTLIAAPQAPQRPSGSKSQESQMAFEVASIKQNKSDAPPYSNFPLNAGGMYVPNGGLFSATNLPLVTYIFFAYNVVGNKAQFLAPQLPGCVMTERFDIQARAEGNPTKDEMRQMMRSLLADRFKLAMHTERREVPVLAFVLAKPEKTGPQLQPHAVTTPCQTTAAPPAPGDPIPETFQRIIAGDLPGPVQRNPRPASQRSWPLTPRRT